MNAKRSVEMLASMLGGTLLTVMLLILFLLSSPAQASMRALFVADQSNSLSSSPVITIGVGVDLSGENASLGWQEANSARLAVILANLFGGVDISGTLYTLAVVVADSGCDPTQAITAANALLSAGAAAVVGHTCSGESLAAQPLYHAAGVAMLSPSNTNPLVTQQGYTTTFRATTHDGAPPVILATYFRNWLGLSRSAIVETSSFTHQSAVKAYSDTFTALGGTITSHRLITDADDITATLMAVQSETPDVIANITSFDDILGIDANRAGRFSRAAYSLGMTNVVIGWNTQSHDESLLTVYADAAGAAATEGDYVMMQFRRFVDMPGWTTFLAAYQAAGFSIEPNDPGLFGPYAYDATRIIIAAIDRADNADPIDIRTEIAATSNFAGVVGTYQGFDAYGDMIPQWAWLERYHGGQWRIVDWGKLFLPIMLRNSGQ